eukprot:3749130-Prymnesium_polylepis.3
MFHGLKGSAPPVARADTPANNTRVVPCSRKVQTCVAGQCARAAGITLKHHVRSHGCSVWGTASPDIVDRANEHTGSTRLEWSREPNRDHHSPVFRSVGVAPTPRVSICECGTLPRASAIDSAARGRRRRRPCGARPRPRPPGRYPLSLSPTPSSHKGR